MKILTKVIVKCAKCSKVASVEAKVLEPQLDEPLSMNNVAQLYGKFRCGNCGSRETFVSEASGRVLIDPNAVTACRVCKKPIPLPRLKALPGADLCTPCSLDAARRSPPAPYPHPPSNLKKCPRSGHPTIVRQNGEDKSFFIGCTGFPACHWKTPYKPDYICD